MNSKEALDLSIGVIIAYWSYIAATRLLPPQHPPESAAALVIGAGRDRGQSPFSSNSSPLEELEEKGDCPLSQALRAEHESGIEDGQLGRSAVHG